LQEEVIQVWEATVAMEGTRDEVVCAAAASVQEAAAARERDTVLIKEVEARFTVVEWEAQTIVAECEVR
jgi:hypothetical protein